MDPQHDDADNAARTDAYPLHPDVEADAANDPVQAAVRTLLRSAPDPGPMVAGHMDMVDADGNGSVTRDELAAAIAKHDQHGE